MFLGDDKTKKITMTEGDFGVSLPLKITVEDEETISEIDSFSIVILKEIHGEKIIEKTFTNIQDNTINLNLTEEESQLLPVGEYYYDLNWYQNNVFMDNLLAKKSFVVEKKAGGVDAS